jgi:hypothetical protein
MTFIYDMEDSQMATTKVGPRGSGSQTTNMRPNRSGRTTRLSSATAKTTVGPRGGQQVTSVGTGSSKMTKG